MEISPRVTDAVMWLTRRKRPSTYLPRLESFESRLNPSNVPVPMAPVEPPPTLVIQLPNEIPIFDTPSPAIRPARPVLPDALLDNVARAIAKPPTPPASQPNVFIGVFTSRTFDFAPVVVTADFKPLAGPTLLDELEKAPGGAPSKIASGSALFGVGGAIDEQTKVVGLKILLEDGPAKPDPEEHVEPEAEQQEAVPEEKGAQIPT